MANSLMSMSQREEFRARLDMNLTFSLGDGQRFRVNLFWQQGVQGMVVRSVRTQVRTLDELGHPAALKTLALARDGLTLIAGRKGSGASTTLAAIVDHRNASAPGHILTIEDPIESVHAPKQCVITQREVGADTRSYADALRNAARQAPDLIAIDEIRHAETFEALLALAESGYACIATVHADDTRQAIERVLSLFPPHRNAEILRRLALAARAVIAQRLLPALPDGRAAALELLLRTPRLDNALREGRLEALAEIMEQDQAAGSCSFDSALAALCRCGRVSENEALKASANPQDLIRRVERLRQLAGSTGQAATSAQVPLRLAREPLD
jgi:twitching motility protein PilU